MAHSGPPLVHNLAMPYPVIGWEIRNGRADPVIPGHGVVGDQAVGRYYRSLEDIQRENPDTPGLQPF